MSHYVWDEENFTQVFAASMTTVLRMLL